MSFDPDKMATLNPEGVPDELNRLSGTIIGAAIEVHTVLGPGLREQIYEAALVLELRRRGVSAARQTPFHVFYKDEALGLQVIDLVVESRVIVECKSVAAVTSVDQSQLLGYLRFTGLPLGLLINFNVARLKDGITRRVNWPPIPHPPGLETKMKSLFAPSVPTP